MLVSESWTILKHDKEIMWFPVLSTIASLVVIAIMGILFYIFFIFVMESNIDAFMDSEESVLLFDLLPVLLFVSYTVLAYIVNFFQAGMFVIIHGRMNGSDLTFNDGIAGAQQVAGKIFLWSVISATLGVILDFISDRSKLVGNAVAALFGATWNTLTYFSLPALVISKTSVIGAFKMSAETIRNTWGETIIITIGTAFFFNLIVVAGMALGFFIMILIPNMASTFYILLLTSFIAVGIVTPSLEAVFKLALFEYARTGVIPKGFSQELIENAIKT